MSGLEVIQASYGVGTTFTDVTKEVQGLVQNGEINFVVSAQSLGILDPAPGVTKTFQAKVSMNKGTPTLLSKNDGEVFAVSAPSAPKSPPSHFFNIFTALWYFLLALSTTYFGMSAYQLGLNAFGSAIAGYLFAAVTLITFGMFGFMVLPFIVFFYALIWPDTLNFNYAIKNIVSPTL